MYMQLHQEHNYQLMSSYMHSVTSLYSLGYKYLRSTSPDIGQQRLYGSEHLAALLFMHSKLKASVIPVLRLNTCINIDGMLSTRRHYVICILTILMCNHSLRVHWSIDDRCTCTQSTYRELRWVNLDPGLCATKRYVHHCTLESHKTCQSLHLILSHIRAVANT